MARKRIPAYKKREYLAAYVMSAPVVLGTVVFFLIPALWSFWLSFTIGPDYFNNTFVGLENYRQLFTADENLRYELFNTFYYAIVVVVLAVVLGVLLANALNREIRGKGLFRVIYFLPSVTMAAAAGVVWRTMFNSQFGVINQLLGAVGIPGPKWLTDPRFMMLAVIIVGIWKQTGHNMIILLAGLTNIDASYYEAADIDGASRWQKLRYVTVPLLSPVIFFVTITSTLNALKVFDVIYTLSGSGGTDERFMRYYRTMVYGIYEKGFQFSRIGAASAEAVVLLAIILVITLIQFKGEKKWVHY